MTPMRRACHRIMRLLPRALAVAVALLVLPVNARAEALTATLRANWSTRGEDAIRFDWPLPLVIKNTSTAPIRLPVASVTEAIALDLDFADSRGRHWVLRHPATTAPPQGRSESRILKPGESIVIKVPLRDYEKGSPPPNTDEVFTVRGLLDVVANKGAEGDGLWIGRLTSSPLTVRISNLSLVKPQDYLAAGHVEHALSMLKADARWLASEGHAGQTPLHVAASLGQMPVVEWLLAHKANVNATAEYDLTPLHTACNGDIAALLVRNGADMSAKSRYGGMTPLHTAARDGRADVVEAMLRHGADVDISDDHGQVPLHLTSNRKTTMALLRRNPRLEGRDSSGTTPLQSAALGAAVADKPEELHAVCQALIAAGAIYDIRSAVCLNDGAQVRALLVKEPAPKEALALLRLAARFGHAPVCRVLRDSVAKSAAASDDTMIAPLIDGIDHPEVVKMLLSPEDVNRPIQWKKYVRGLPDSTANGATLLHWAAEWGNVRTVKVLIDHGASLSAKDETGQTALHVAAYCLHADVIRTLLQNGASPSATNTAGKTPLTIARTSERLEPTSGQRAEAIRLLEAAGASKPK